MTIRPARLVPVLLILAGISFSPAPTPARPPNPQTQDDHRPVPGNLGGGPSYAPSSGSAGGEKRTAGGGGTQSSNPYGSSGASQPVGPASGLAPYHDQPLTAPASRSLPAWVWIAGLIVLALIWFRAARRKGTAK